MNKNSHIEKYLENYLTLDKPEFAVLLSGKWGSGKTYFINKFIKEQEKNQEGQLKFIKISLFGLKEVDSIDEQIFQNLHPILGNKYVKLTGNIAKNALKFGIKLDWKDDSKPDGTGSIDLSKFNLFDFFSDEKKSKIKIIFVFDDLERTDIDLIEVLGYINYLVEQSEFNVIILANEEKLKDIEENDNVKNYLGFKEKVIGKTFQIQHDFENILMTFINDNTKKSKRYLKENKDIISNIYFKKEHHNLRHIKQILLDFEFFSKKVFTKYLKNKEFVRQLVREFFEFSLFIKITVPNKDKLIEKLAKTETETKNLFIDDIWIEILFNNNFTDINKLINDLHYFIKKEEQPLWFKLYHYDSLENDEFTKLMDKMIYNFNNCQYINEPSELVSVIDILLYFSQHELCSLTDKDIRNKVEECIDNESSLWNAYLENNNYIKYNGLGYKSKKNFIGIKDIIIDKFESRKKNYNKKLSNKEFIKDKAIVKKAIEDNDTKNLFKFLMDKYQDKNLFELISLDEFIDSIKKSKNENTNNKYLYIRYSSHKNISFLEVELESWQKVHSKLSDYCKNTNKTLKIHLIEKFNNDTIEKIIEILKKSKNEEH